MDDYQKIALSTGEDSLAELHSKIIHLLEQQSPSVKNLIEQLIDYYQKIILCMPGNVYWMDRDCKTVGCNQKVLDMFGLKQFSDFENLSFEDMAEIGSWTKEQGESFKRDTMEVIESGSPKMNVEEPAIPDAQGNLLYFLSSRMPLFNKHGDVMGIVGISTDITYQKITEQALAKANKVKSEFLANLSHDIRTPLASMVSLTETLNNRIEDPEVRELAFDAQTCAEQVLMLVDEILEVTEINLGKVQKDEQAFNISALFQAIHALMSNAAKQKGLEFRVKLSPEIPPILFGKRQLFHRIILNLLSNAIKFTDSGVVTVDASLVNLTKERAIIRVDVSDTGIGIPEASHEQIFEQFERLSSTYKNEYEGRGLGLYIVKEFVYLMQGTVSVDSKKGKGSKFSVEVSLAIANESQKKQIIMEHGIKTRRTGMHTVSDSYANSNTADVICNKQPGIKVLLVEDTDIARKAAVATLIPLDCNVDIAKTGNEAIEKVKENSYDIILLDIGLPDISGLRVAKNIRDYEQQNNLVPLPIIALTAHITQSATQQCINSGIQQVLRKPLTSARAHALFSNWLAELYDHKSFDGKRTSADKLDSELYQKFIDELPQYKQKISAAHKNYDKKQLQNVTHMAHGAARYLKLIPLQKACNSLESALTDEFSDTEIHILYQDLMEEIDILLE